MNQEFMAFPKLVFILSLRPGGCEPTEWYGN